MENVEIPEYFICPISLQIMKDPVTIVTGITYDRDSIERWLSKNPNSNAICPVTKLHVSRDSNLTPNHTLRRLIQSWCVSNGFNVVDQVLTPKPTLSKCYILNLVLDLSVPRTENIKTLEKLEMLAKENNERNKTYMVEVGVHEALVNFLIQCYMKCDTNGLEKALSTLSLIWDYFSSCHENNKVENREEILIDSITWALGLDRDMQNHAMIKNHAMSLLRSIIGKANSSTLDRLKPQLFEKIIRVLRESGSNTTTIAQKGVDNALHVILNTSHSGKNRNIMIQSRAIFELIELELNFSSNKKTKELIFEILFNLCSCADGRAQLLSHAAGIAMITKRILKVSPIVDEKAIMILCLITKYSATSGVLQEMLKVKSVSKICTMIQANCASHVKDKAREILRNHFDVWKNSPCVEVATLTRKLISKFSSTPSVVQEMLSLGVVAKLCLVLQVDCGSKGKERAREILKFHAKAWMNSPCIPNNLLSSYPF